jgi:hypothetical protein
MSPWRAAMTPRVTRASVLRMGARSAPSKSVLARSTSPEHFPGEVPGHLVLGELPVAVHGVEIELGRIDHEVMANVLRVGHRIQQPPPAIQRDLGHAPVADPRPGLGLLGGRAVAVLCWAYLPGAGLTFG